MLWDGKLGVVHVSKGPKRTTGFRPDEVDLLTSSYCAVSYFIPKFYKEEKACEAEWLTV